MNEYQKITLKQGKEKSLHRRHPWVFSGAIAHKGGHIENGDIVEVFDHNGNYIATGHYSDSTIAVKLFSFRQCHVNAGFWLGKLKDAAEFRAALGLPNPQTNMFRLVNGEGDGLPGLVIDIFGSHAVLQFHSAGMYRIRETIVDSVKELLPWVSAFYFKSAMEDTDREKSMDGWRFGAPANKTVAVENGISFVIDIEKGQKTGFFLDQRESRAILGEFAKGRKVLNTFSYSGGFSLYALKNGASHVDSVDISAKAVALVEENVRLLGGDFARRHSSYCEDVFNFLEKIPANQYDIIVLDPPAFAKHVKDREQGLKGYRNINRKAMEKIRRGGFLFTFSCSQAVGRDDFQTAVFSAAALSGREVRIVQRLQHAPDHPVSIFHPEGEYLKGLLLEIR